MPALILFGATGDLARRMLLPSLFALQSDGLLAEDLMIVGTARSELDDEGFRALAGEAIAAAWPTQPADRLRGFLERLCYRPADATRPDSFRALSQLVAQHRPASIFLSTAPSLFQATIAGLGSSGLAAGDVRLALEKPLGHDLASSRQINDSVAALFPEDRIFRVDHYLGKETVQNLIALRFANTLFEPLWRSDSVTHVQLSVCETVGLEGRGAFYDATGALRDMVQNHMLQLLALLAMEPPARLTATSVRDEKVKVLTSLRPINADDVERLTVRGQYQAGAIAGAAVPGYADELGRASPTETFVALKAHIDNWRWKGVPFFLRTGKRLTRRKSEIVVAFRPVPHSIFGEEVKGMQPNRLVINLQPDENIRLSLVAKQPGLDRKGMRLNTVTLDIGDQSAFAEVRRRIAYERLLLDLIEGRPTLFVRRDEVEAQWTYIDQIRAGWAEAGTGPAAYTAGSWGPAEAHMLIGRDGAAWND
ncbi:glucose-6-phosphate dehydrogenase [Thermaurantiacus sp.]